MNTTIRPRILTFAFALVLITSSIAKEIPTELQRLNEQRSQRIAEIDKIYLRQLEALKIQYTRSADLESANVVAAIIKQMSKNSNIPTTDDELTDYLRGTKWIFDDGSSIIFHQDGKIRKSHGVLTPDWHVKNLELLIPNESRTFKFFNNFTEANVTDRSGKRTAKIMANKN